MSSHHFTNKKTEAQRVEPEIGILMHMIYCRSILKRRGERKQIRKEEGGKWKRSLSGVCLLQSDPTGALAIWIILHSWFCSEKRIAFRTLILVSHVLGSHSTLQQGGYNL